MKKLKNRRGETLAETLVSVLIAALSALLLTAMATAAGNMDAAARRRDREFYEALTAVETKTGAPSRGQITITGDVNVTENVEVYSSGGLTAYAPSESAGD